MPNRSYSARHPLILKVPGAPTPKYRQMKIPDEDRHTPLFALPNSGVRRNQTISFETSVEDVAIVLSQTFLPDELVTQLHQSTNAYAHHHCPPRKQRVINEGDILHFFALYYYFGIVKLPAKKEYWGNQWDFLDVLPERHPFTTQRGITEGKFNYLFRYIHPTFQQ